MSGRIRFCALFAILVGVATFPLSAENIKADSLMDRAQRQVITFFTRMSDLTCTEDVVQQKLRADGHVETSEKSKYDYLVMVEADNNDLQLNESRIQSSDSPHKPLPLLVTNGFSMLLLVFHPYYRDSFRFAEAPAATSDPNHLVEITFSHIPGTRSPAALALRGREYPLDLEGTAWIDERSGQITRMEAHLARDMSDVGLRAMKIDVDYKPSTLPGAAGMPLPDRAVIDLESLRQHWRNTHIFTDYKSFSTAAQQTTVKVISKDLDQKSDQPDSQENPQQQEKP